MKRIAAAIIMLALVLTSCIASIRVLQKNSTELIELLESAAFYAQHEDSDSLKAVTDKIQINWEKSRKQLSLFLPHSELDALSITVPTLSDFCCDEAYDEYLEACYESVHTLEHLNHSAKPRLENLF